MNVYTPCSRLEMQEIKFLDSLIVQKNMRDDEWIELKWNPVIEQMWRNFALTAGDIRIIHTEMEKIKQRLIGQGYHIKMSYQQDLREGKGELWCGWDSHMYARSVDDVFNKIQQLLS